MKTLIALIWCLPLIGQEIAPAPAQAATAAPVSPVATPDRNITGDIDFGYRWRSDPGGSEEAWRSVVNLGSGVKIFAINLSITDPKSRLFDRFDLHGANWGDPYNTVRLDMSLKRAYRLSVDYRSIAYYNFLPSFADPTTGQGIFLNQRSFDMNQRYFNADLELRPTGHIRPFLAFTHESGIGSGVTDYVSDLNSYPVANRLDSTTSDYRGGVRLEYEKWHATLEQGGTTYKEDQQVFTSGQNLGNFTTPLFGEQLFLSNLRQAYGVRGDSIYTRGLFTASPYSWLNLSGSLMFSEPSSSTNYLESATGNFLDLSTLIFSTNVQSALLSSTAQPHASGNLNVEIHPMKRLRVIESWLTDRLHDSGSVNNAALPYAREVWNYNQQQLDVLFDITPWITLRGGYRYVWGESLVRSSTLDPYLILESGQIRQNVAIAGLTFKAGPKLSGKLDFEAASGGRNYFRSSLQNYQKVRSMARYKPTEELRFGFDAMILNNDNPLSLAGGYSFREMSYSFSLFWSPKKVKSLSLNGDYMWSRIHSNTTYLIPQALVLDDSAFFENAHTASAALDYSFGLFHGSLGGSLFTSAGTSPISFYQPLARIAARINKRVEWNAEWRWYGLSEAFYSYEGFRAHTISTGLRVSLE